LYSPLPTTPWLDQACKRPLHGLLTIYMKQQDTYNQVQPLKGRTNYKLPKTNVPRNNKREFLRHEQYKQIYKKIHSQESKSHRNWEKHIKWMS
jgi:hypothetical protein